MATAEQVLANRANAQHSTGPVTEAGKAQSARNATRHGFTGQTVVLAPEEEEPYRLFTEGFLTELAPVGSLETQLVHSIVDARWRMNQIVALQSALYALGDAEHADKFKDKPAATATSLRRALTFKENQKEFDRLNRYEARLHRQAKADKAELVEIQTARQARELAEWKKAASYLEHHQATNKPFNPADFGFVWSVEQIERRVAGHNLKMAALARNNYQLLR